MLATASPDTTGTPPASSVETKPMRLLVRADKINDARAAGLRVPTDENAEEFLDNPSKRLGWFWVYDDTRLETCEERRARYLADHRIIDMKGFARVICRSYALVKDMKFESDGVRAILRGLGVLDGADLEDKARVTALAETLASHAQIDLDTARARLLAQANEDILKATPAARDRVGQSDLWYVSDAIPFGRRSGRLDEWYSRATIKQTGRPPGSRTKNRKTS